MGVMIPEKDAIFDRVGSHFCYQCSEAGLKGQSQLSISLELR